jgi:tetratricopeptide (TPR) repeat protein
MRRKKTCRSSLIKYQILIAIFVLSACFVSGCGYIGKYSKAQDYFNAAAHADMGRRFNPDPNIDIKNELIASNQINTNYALAYRSITELIEKKKDSLKKDSLLGNALTIKAMSEWKLGKYVIARETAVEALKENKDQLFPRDIALMIAMPGLIKTDQAYFHVMSIESDKTYEDIKDMILGDHGAINDIEDALKAVDTDHTIKVYLLMSELAAFRTLQVAIEKKVKNATDRTNNQKELREQHIVPKVEDFKSQLNTLRLQNQDQWIQILSYWKALLGV